MRVSPDLSKRVLEAIETSLFWIPDAPGVMEHLEVPGVQGHITPLSHPLVNLVGAAQLTPDNADNSIAVVRDVFARENKAFGWIVGPLTQPQNMGERLLRAGLTRIDEMAGMSLMDLDVRVPANPDIEIRQVAPDDMPPHSAWGGRAYGLPDGVARLFFTAIARGQRHLRMLPYLAFVQGRPVAWSYLTYMPGQSVAVLGGAATLPEHRGSGIYRSMVAQRLEDARTNGARAAAIQAVRSTSAPILERLGFQEVGAMEFYAWAPTHAGES